MIIVLTGSVHSGKTSLIQSCLPGLSEAERTVGGFLSLAVFDHSERVGYDLLDLDSGQCYPWLRKGERRSGPRIGPWILQPRTLNRAKDLISEGASRDICIIDEIGPLEMRGEGFWPGLCREFPHAEAVFILVTRESLVDTLARRLLPVPVDRVFHVRDATSFAHFAAGL